MKPKIIQVNFTERRSVPVKRHAIWTREELRVWTHMGGDTKQKNTLVLLLLVTLLHFGLVELAQLFKDPHELDEGGEGGAARVTFFEGSSKGASEEGTPEPNPFPNKPVDSPVITGPSTSRAAPAVPDPVPQKDSPKPAPKTGFATRTKPTTEPSVVKIPETKAQQTPQQSSAVEDVSPTAPPQPQDEAAPDEPATSSGSIGFSRNLRDLLPNSESEFVSSQRRVGAVYGRGAVGGDLSPDSDAPVGFKAPDRKKVVVKRYDYAAYFMSLDRRFADAWGGTRTLPRGSSFLGKVGEFISYDIVINRDGTLIKIVNVTKQKEPHRDFSAVDRLVNDVFSNVFPMQPVPDRIREDPLILRKRIQFTGYKYLFF